MLAAFDLLFIFGATSVGSGLFTQSSLPQRSLYAVGSGRVRAADDWEASSVSFGPVRRVTSVFDPKSRWSC